MIDDAALPSGVHPSSTAGVERHGVFYTAARWTPEDLRALARGLATEGSAALDQLPPEQLLDAWSTTVELYLDPGSQVRRRLDPVLARFCRLSPAGLSAALEAVLGGVRRESATELFRQARPSKTDPVLVILASNLPALAVQSLLPSLAVRRPVILKSPSSEPLFAPAFVRTLAEHEPVIAQAVAALTWSGGQEGLEAPLLEEAGQLLAYGEAQTIDDLERRAKGKVFAYGPKTSLAILGADVEESQVAAGLARDVALFDQRGCLSVQAVYTAGPPELLAAALASELGAAAERWPAGPLDPISVAGVQQIRSDAQMRGLQCPELPIAVGTIVVEPRPDFQPSPGLRTVRIHPVEALDHLPEILAPWSGKLQGAALAGDEAWALGPALAELGISRQTPPGELQSPDALWHNGGVHPLEVLGDYP